VSVPPLIAIVDDDASLCSALETLLRSLGYRPTAYESALHLLASSDVRHYQCVISDISMPGMSGLELKRELRAIGAGDIPVILITARTEPTLLARAKASGAHSLLTKPFGVDQLIASLTDALAG
jgi:FixJ family two-component response regulator